ncbi:hypothetical protein DERP_004025 [Dermatophagoides pteronyssinus]|uniref:Uncharacterized protein n=1 Tax=Dermatophagoides pteronyssinus TaxID=6956 RepID=A0ABQ8J7X7_DERPT|nr:hypothetical protein DERP_004025 [Dermatophagoides pteronyssinus]
MIDVGDGVVIIVRLSVIGDVDVEPETIDNVCGSAYESELADDDNDVCNDVVSDEIDCGGLGGGGGGGGFRNNVLDCDPVRISTKSGCGFCCAVGIIVPSLNAGLTTDCEILRGNDNVFNDSNVGVNIK